MVNWTRRYAVARTGVFERVLAPRARFELATLRLTAECSTIELPGNRVGRNEALLEKCSEEDVRVSMKRDGFLNFQPEESRFEKAGGRREERGIFTRFPE